jgi:sugar (pentulose or hexulose) kinase
LAGLGDPLTEALLEAASLRPPLSIHRRLVDLLDPWQREERTVDEQISQCLRRHSAVEVLRLLLDAIFLGQRMMLEELEQQSEPARRVYCVGGLAAYGALNQLHADVLGRTIDVPPVTDSGARGAAMLACMALGPGTPSEAAAHCAQPNRVCHPRRENEAVYEGLAAEIHARFSDWLD